MITIEQLKHMRESEDHVEFKAARHNFPYNGGSHNDPVKRRHCVLGYIVALANERSGRLVLGMEDARPHQVCSSDFAQGMTGKLTDAIYEALHIRVNILELFEGNKRVLVIEVPSRPIGRLLKFEGVALMRTGESLREMSDSEMFAILSEQEPDFSAKICDGLRPEDLDTKAIKAMKSKYAEKQKNRTFLTEPTEQILRDLNLLVDDKLTYAALILLGKQEAIRRYLPQDEIIVEYRLNESSIPFTARKEFQEPLMLAVDDVWNYVNQPASNPLQHVSNGPYIFDVPSFNRESIREAILNAVSHRSMQIQSSVVVKQSPKSITIINAGGFPKGVDIYNILTTSSTPRSKLLCEVLEKTGLIERSGQGVDKIYYNCLEEGKPLPDYSRSDAYQVCLTLKAEVEDPAFHLFVDEEQGKRDENHQLSVFHLLELYKIKSGNLDNLDSTLVEQLMAEGLAVNVGDKLQLSSNYAPQRHQSISSEQLAQRLGVKLGVKLDVSNKISALILDYLIDNQSIDELYATIDELGVKLGVKLGVNAVTPSRSLPNRTFILLLLAVNPNLTRKELSSLLAVSMTTIDKHLTWLRQNNIINREGSDKKGRWIIND